MVETQTFEESAPLSPAGMTAQFVTVARALESESDNPLFNDPFARAFAGRDGFVSFARNKVLIPARAAALFMTALAIRTRFFDDALNAAVNRGIRQIVIVGAGFDSRAFRLPFPGGVKVWELDRKDIFDFKERVLTDLRAVAKCERTILEVDIRDEWRDDLRVSGFDPSLPSAFLVEGLLLYLGDQDVEELLRRIGSMASAGSWLGVDVFGTELLEFEPLRRQREWLAALGTPWLFSTKNPEKLMGDHGWKAHCAVPGEKDANYGRWPFPPMPRWVPGIPRNFYVSAMR